MCGVGRRGGGAAFLVLGELHSKGVTAGGAKLLARLCHLPWRQIGLEMGEGSIVVVGEEGLEVGCWGPWCFCQCARAKA